MTIKITAMAAILALAGCASSVPDSNPNVGGGVGFDDYNGYAQQRARRDAQLEAGRSVVPDDRAIAMETLGVLNDTAPVTTSQMPQTGTAAPTNHPGISDEQNFDAVASRETIESDRERLQQQRDSLVVVQPEALPDRPSGNAAPNIVSFALSTNNGVGQAVYDRSQRFNEDRYRRACAGFASSDQAQAAFLAAGGPKRDRRGIDPDGDGFACFWDPTPFRNARGG